MQTRTNTTSSIGTMLSPALQQMKSDNSRRRKQMKPEWARFKASIKYKNNETKKPMFSYDWNKVYIDSKPIGQDREDLGLQTIILWLLKCVKDGTLEYANIFMTFREDKRTNVMDYDTSVFYFHHTTDATEMKPIKQLRFDEKGKVIMSKELLDEKLRQQMERDTMPNRYR